VRRRPSDGRHGRWRSDVSLLYLVLCRGVEMKEAVSGISYLRWAGTGVEGTSHSLIKVLIVQDFSVDEFLYFAFTRALVNAPDLNLELLHTEGLLPTARCEVSNARIVTHLSFERFSFPSP